MNSDKLPVHIAIRGQIPATTEVLNNRRYWWVISIRDGKETSAPIDSFKGLCLGILPLYFDDVCNPEKQHEYVFPKIE